MLDVTAMGVAREYTAAQALKILNQSEGLVVRSRIRRAPLQDESPAHTFARHLMYAGHYGKGESYKKMSPQAGLEGIRDRFINAPTNVSSGWFRKGDMAVRLVELLNSDIGQEALGLLDRGVRRVAVHYRNRAVMKLAIKGGNVFDPKHASATYDVTPETKKAVPHDIFNKKGEFIKTIMKMETVPKKVTPVLHHANVVGVHVVLEKFGSDGLHVQTFFPSAALDMECIDYEVGTVKCLVFQDENGEFVTKMAAKT
jgi:hypothetical protein